MHIHCLSCSTETDNWFGRCPVCGFIPKIIEGVKSWSPELSVSVAGEFFYLLSFKELAAYENSRFWFQARNELIL